MNADSYSKCLYIFDTTAHSLPRNLHVLCEGGADISLTDVEGNTPQDLADKNGQNKCVKYLNNQRKQKTGKQSKVRQYGVCTCMTLQSS